MIHILVVEDDPKQNKIISTYLNDSGFHAKGCLNANEAYDEMYNCLYEMIISDIMMPGIDGYMVKPIELDELLLRVRALLRRANIEMERKLTAGNLELDADAVTAAVNGVEIPVTTREFNILYKLLSYPKKTFSRAQLMDEFWGIESETSLRAVDVYVTKLRDKCSDCDGFKIVTVRGLGYKAVL